MDWITKVKLMRQAIAQSMTFSGPGANALHVYFMDQLHMTDHFHPFDTDSAMSPTTMDPELVFVMFDEVDDLIRGHFDREVSFNADAATDIFFKLVDKHPS